MMAYGILYPCRNEALGGGNASRDPHETPHSDHIARILSEIKRNQNYHFLIKWFLHLYKKNSQKAKHTK